MPSPAKFCCYCGREGHLANKCPLPRDIPVPKPPPEPVVIVEEEDENWLDYYGGY